MAKDKTRRKLTAVVHADVKGYSRLMQEDDEYTVRTLASNRKEMYRLVKIHKGHVRDTAGDGFLVEFPSVVNAVKFSVEFQREMKKRNENVLDDRKMEFRIGINIGDVIHDGGTIHGDGVNVAARLEGIADPGGICLSVAAFEQVKKKLDVGFKFIGEHTVKNIAEPVPTYKVLFDTKEVLISGKKPLQPKRTTLRKAYVIAAVVVIVAVASVGVWYFLFYPGPFPKKTTLEGAPDLPLPDKPSIAVLPFDNLSGDPKQEYFSDGITEAIITGLSKMPRLFVIARNSSFAFKGKPVDIKDVGRKLGVRYVLEGSVGKQAERVRITVQLIDSRTSAHVWSERYDRKLKDIFILQDEITLDVILAMRVKLTEGDQLRFRQEKTRATNLEAYWKYLQARAYIFHSTKSGNASARRLCEEIIALEPEFAPGYTVLAFVSLTDGIMGWSKNPRTSGMKAFKMASRAIELDESLDGAHYVLGMVYAFLGQHDKAIAEGERAVELNPNGSEALAFLGQFLNWADRPKEAIPIIQNAIRLNPFPAAFYYYFLGNSFRQTDQYKKAIEMYNKGIIKQPEHFLCLINLACTYSLAGRQEEARKTATEFLRLNPNFSLKHWEKMVPFKDPSVKKRYIDALRKAGLK